MQAEFESLTLGMTLAEINVLRGKHGLRSHIVGIHDFPAARYGATMEDNLQAMTGGIVEDVFIELHGTLFVAAEKVNLDTFHADFLQPRHLVITRNSC